MCLPQNKTDVQFSKRELQIPSVELQKTVQYAVIIYSTTP